MERNQFWIFLLIAVVFGVGMHQMIKTPSAGMKISGVGLRDILEDGAPVYDPNYVEAKVATARPPQSDEDEEEDEEETPTAAKPATVPGAPIAKAEANKDAEKKKKKKKKKAQTEVAQQPQQPKVDDSNDKKKSAPAAGAGAPAQIAGGEPPQAPFDENAIPRTAKEWEDYLLREPDFERTSKFVRYHQVGIVSNQIFFDVTSLMVLDSRPKMREMGVMALGASPNSRSFAMLVQLQRSESANSPLKGQVSRYIQMYKRLENLRHLASALTQQQQTETSALTSYEALKLLRMAVAEYIDDPVPAPGSVQAQGRVPATAPASKYFGPLLPVLTGVSAHSPDANVRQAAQQTINEITGLITKKST